MDHCIDCHCRLPPGPGGWRCSDCSASLYVPGGRPRWVVKLYDGSPPVTMAEIDEARAELWAAKTQFREQGTAELIGVALALKVVPAGSLLAGHVRDNGKAKIERWFRPVVEGEKKVNELLASWIVQGCKEVG